MIEHRWSEQLKPGDKVIIESGHPGLDRNRVAEFVRYTKTQIIVKWKHLDDLRFNRKTLFEKSGGDWFKDSLEEATPERLHKIEVSRLRSRARTELERAAAMTKTMPESWLRFFVDWQNQMRKLHPSEFEPSGD